MNAKKKSPIEIAFQENVVVIGVFILMLAAIVCVGLRLAGAPPPPPDVRRMTRELEPFVGQSKPWSRADLLELRATVENLIEE